MVFALRAAEGVKDPEHCLGLTHENRQKLTQYLEQFHFDL
jgi:hypothetical protein